MDTATISREQLNVDTLHLPLRVMVVDDHDVVREGLRALLEASGEIVVAEAADVAGAVATALAERPQVILMDVRLGHESGVDATRRIREVLPDARVVMITSFPDADALAASILAGACGFVLKTVTGNDIVRSVRAVARGEHAFDGQLLIDGGFDRVSELLATLGRMRTVVPAEPGPSPVGPDTHSGNTEEDGTNQGG